MYKHTFALIITFFLRKFYGRHKKAIKHVEECVETIKKQIINARNSTAIQLNSARIYKATSC